MLNMQLEPGQEWPADLYTHPDCMNLDPSRDYGEDFMDLFAGCVLGALEQDNIPLAQKIFATAKASSAQRRQIHEYMIKYVGVAVAAEVVHGTAAAKPWYKNWKVLAPVGVAASLLVGVTVYAVKRKRRRG
jgi:hypothetical protein